MCPHGEGMDRELVRLAMAGDRDAFDSLAAASIGRLYGVAVLILRDPDRAADATQDALVSAWRDLSAVRDPDRFEAWLHRVLVRCCYREAGRERRRRTVEVRALPDERTAPDGIPELIERDRLDRAFRRLDVEERTVIVLHHIEGFLLTEIADVLGIPVGTVKSRLHRGKRAMRAALDADARIVPIEQGRIA
jgi:RNA polymerase sigma-70 factor, ECF subfamily